ncbi:MAG: hypothetical protein H0U88_06820 [Chthoniobacterales bacterium]|nr:hypothetical protein [Chthoniobacterales bacterium]
MTIPFLHFFKRKPKQPALREVIAKPALVAEKPSSDRLSKTVLPSASRLATAQDPFHVNANSSPSSSATNGAASAPAAARTVAFSSPISPPRTPDFPPALALALEPKVERVVSLELGDIVPQMPAGWVKELSADDASRRVLLKAAELERGMSNGKPSVSIATIYRQVPEIFLRPVEASDSAQVRLPFAKVLEQFTNLQLRSDQYRDQSVPQFETPFLKVTLEDNERFGTTTETFETGDFPPVRVEPATADSFAAAEPEPAAFEMPAAPVARFPIQFPAHPNPKQDGPESPVSTPESTPAPAAAPTRIPFKLSPIGTDAPAAESIPTSNGTSVPTSLPTATAPTRIPFQIAAPDEDSTPKAEPWLTKESFGLETKAVSTHGALHDASKGDGTSNGVKISLPLKPILHALPPFQLTADISNVPEDTRIELPFSLVEPQLASGRVSVRPEDFATALPEQYRSLFTAKDIAAPVVLPLQDVLKNLPVASLRMREDQTDQEVGVNFVTPFSAKAEEDAKRFNMTSAPLTKPMVEAVVIPAMAEPKPAPSFKAGVQAPELEVAVSRPIAAPFVLHPLDENSQPGKRTGLQELFDTDDDVDAKAVVSRVSEMAGLRACGIMFCDGLSLAGNLPEELQADGLCALAPSMLQRMKNHLEETQVGELRAMTRSCTNATFTFVMQDNVCLAALHPGEQLTPETRARLGRTVQELSREYSHPV